MAKNCIFNKAKVCNDCGDCYKCEFDSKKTCDNCGKCMSKEGYDLKQIKIDDVLEMPDDINEYSEYDDVELVDAKEVIEEYKDEYCECDQDKQQELEYEFIEDHLDVKEILDDDKKFSQMASEVFPGLIKIATKR